jgi:hypothetical protein
MKWYVAVVLTLAVMAAGVVTRPSQASFANYLERRLRDKVAGGAAPLSLAMDRRLFPTNYVYKNRYLWADMELDGTVVYTGLFEHWFSRRGAAD